MENKKLSLTIGWLYPDLMSTYGDRGNVITMQKRAEWRGIKTEVKHITVGTSAEEISSCDILFMGGAQDLQQEIVTKDLEHSKGKPLKQAIDKGIPGLFICGGFQFLGKYYKAADGTMIPGLSIFDLYTEHPGERKDRCIGNVIIQPTFGDLEEKNIQFVGFENHGGRTYLSDNKYAWGKVVKVFGNN
jgi:lipid II isoglutaminyl synthase (glutamine-hydrolysing)